MKCAELLLAQIPGSISAEDGFMVLPVPGKDAYMVGRSSLGHPSLLIAAAGKGRTTPLRLANLDVSFAVPCRVSQMGHPAKTETLTVIACVSENPDIQAYFANALDLFIGMIGDSPTLDAVVKAVDRLVTLFQSLVTPPRQTVIGLVGELLVIDAARSPTVAVAAWRADPEERFDFVVGCLRLDSKVSRHSARVHSVSFEQANPVLGVRAYLSSAIVRDAGGGTSVAELMEEIEVRLESVRAVERLRSVVARTLGQALPAARRRTFDLPQARASLAIYEAGDIPALRPPLPRGVSGVRFDSCFGECEPKTKFDGLSEEELQLLPAHRSARKRQEARSSRTRPLRTPVPTSRRSSRVFQQAVQFQTTEDTSSSLLDCV